MKRTYDNTSILISSLLLIISYVINIGDAVTASMASGISDR